MNIFTEVQKYGVKALLFKPSQSVVDEVFNMIRTGDLENLKKVSKTMPPKDFIAMDKLGSGSTLIFAADCERIEIVKWMVEELQADVN